MNPWSSKRRGGESSLSEVFGWIKSPDIQSTQSAPGLSCSFVGGVSAPSQHRSDPEHPELLASCDCIQPHTHRHNLCRSSGAGVATSPPERAAAVAFDFASLAESRLFWSIFFSAPAVNYEPNSSGRASHGLRAGNTGHGLCHGQ